MSPYSHRFCLLLLLVGFSFGSPCLAQENEAKTVPFQICDSFPQLEARLRQVKEGTTLVINFWATWCGSCVEELPYFESLRQLYAGQNVEIILVSLDFKSRLEKSVIPFLKEHQVKSEVILLADQDSNNWIPRVHENWEGGIPATMVLRGNTKTFYNGKFDDLGQLETFVLNSIGAVTVPSAANPGER